MNEEQLTALREAIETMILRVEQVFKLQEERLTAFLQKAEEMTKTVEMLRLTNEALQQSLSENDRALDDQAQITATMVKIIRPALQAAQKEQ